MNKDQVFRVIRSSPDPLDMAGIMALIHAGSNSNDPLHLYSRVEHDNLIGIIQDLIEEGKVNAQTVGTEVYTATS